jgi:GT2 family glycosyltransferase
MTSDKLPIRVVCATRVSRDKFLSNTALGKSIKSYIEVSTAEVKLYAENSTGLSEIYNKAIEESTNSPAILVFVHDDIVLYDFFWSERIRDGVEKFDIAGLAGNLRRVSKQPSWAFVNDSFNWDLASNLSGTVAHGVTFPLNKVLPFGPSNQECKLLDGVFLAVKSELLIKSNLRFDENFKFHFYDLDFCRQAELKNLTMGTIPLSIVHESGGSFNSEAWRNSYQLYLSKWDY